MVGQDSYRPGQAAADMLLVTAVLSLLAAIHFLVPGVVREAYVLVPDAATPVTMFTAAFLHVDDAHLLGNLVGFTIGILGAYLLCLLLRERQWFWLSTVVLVLGLPILVNWTSLLVLTGYFGDVSTPIRGFSGVASGFGGFAFAALLAYVARRTDRSTTLFAGLAVTLVLLLEILVIYAGEFPLTSIMLVALGVGLCTFEAGRRMLQCGPVSRADWRRIGRVSGVFLWTFLVLAVLTAGFFPSEIIQDGQFTNIYSHAIGFGYGFVISGWGHRYWRTTYPS